MKKSLQNQEELTSLFNHLQDKSFRTLITWKGLTCQSNHLEIFESIVLSTWKRGLGLYEFFKSCQMIGVAIEVNKGKLLIEFPKNEIIQNLLKKKRNLTNKKPQFKEDKLSELQEMINKVKEKLEKAFEINKQIKNELSMSNEIQMSESSEISEINEMNDMTEIAVRV